jgi:O-antigen ligase
VREVVMTKQITFPEHIWERLLLGCLALFPFLIIPGRDGESGWLLGKIGLLAVIGLLGLVQAKGWKDYRNVVSLLLIAHLVLVVISILNGRDDLVVNIFGHTGRADGLLYHVTLVLFGLVVYRVANSSHQFSTNLLRVFIFSALLQALIVILQRVGIDLIGPMLQGKPYLRTIGTMGHESFVASLLTPTIIALFFYKIKVNSARLSLALQGSLLLLISIGFGVCVSRASLLGVFIVLILITLIYRKKSFFAGLAVVSIGVYFGYALLPTAGLNAEKEVVSASTLFTRIEIWRLAFSSLREMPGQPFIGSGPDAFQKVLLEKIPVEDIMEQFRLEYAWPENAKIKEIQTFYEPEKPIRTKFWMVYFDDFGTEENAYRLYTLTLDKAHNFFLDRLLSFGGVNLIVWLIFYSVPLWWGIRQKSTTALAFAWSLFAIGIYYLTWFPAVQLEPVHLTIACCLWGLKTSSSNLSN